MDVFQTSDEVSIIENDGNKEKEQCDVVTVETTKSSDAVATTTNDACDDNKSVKLDNDVINYENYLKLVQENLYTRRLVHIEYASIIATVISFIVLAILAYEDDSVSAFAFATDSFLDILAYMVVIWRFTSVSNRKLKSSTKDRVALLCLGFFFVLSSIGVEYESLHNLIFKIKPIPSFLFIIIGFFETLLFGLLSILKFLLAKRIKNNKTVISDGINSLIASASALSMTIGMSSFVINRNIWYLDAIFGFFMGLCVFIYGFKLIVSNTCFYVQNQEEDINETH